MFRFVQIKYNSKGEFIKIAPTGTIFEAVARFRPYYGHRIRVERKFYSDGVTMYLITMGYLHIRNIRDIGCFLRYWILDPPFSLPTVKDLSYEETFLKYLEE